MTEPLSLEDKKHSTVAVHASIYAESAQAGYAASAAVLRVNQALEFRAAGNRIQLLSLIFSEAHASCQTAVTHAGRLPRH
jgi:hypothetical protein